MEVLILCFWVTFDNIMLKMLNAIPSLLQLLQTDNIAANGIVDHDIGCLLCAFLVFFGGCLGFFFVVLFFQKNVIPFTLLLCLISIL